MPEKTIHGCIIYLLRNIKNPLEEDVEHLCKLLSIAGKEIDSARARSYVDQYFARILQLSQQPALPSRLRFMLQDVLALRAVQWTQKRVRSEPAPEESEMLFPSSLATGASTGAAQRGGPSAARGTSVSPQQPYVVENSAVAVGLSPAEVFMPLLCVGLFF